MDPVGFALPKFHYLHGTGNIFVTADGNAVVAHRVVAMLIKAGYPKVIIGVPNPSEYQGPCENVVKFCWEQAETYAPALKDVKTVFCAHPHHKDWREQFVHFLGACRTKNIKHLVKLSFYHSLTPRSSTMGNFVTTLDLNDPFLKVPLVQAARECDGMIIKAHFLSEYTILFASHFMSNPLVYQAESIAKEGKFTGASEGKGVNYVSPNDVAEVAVRALVAPKEHHRTGYTLTGPSAIKDEEFAAAISKSLNKPVRYEDKTLAEFCLNVKDTEWGPALDVAYLEQVKATGTEEDLSFATKKIETICGRPAETVEQYLADRASMTPAELVAYKSVPVSTTPVSKTTALDQETSPRSVKPVVVPNKEPELSC